LSLSKDEDDEDAGELNIKCYSTCMRQHMCYDT
jgi:hypothetical protein